MEMKRAESERGNKERVPSSDSYGWKAGRYGIPVRTNGVERMKLAEGQPVQEEGQQLIGKAVGKHGSIVITVNLWKQKHFKSTL